MNKLLLWISISWRKHHPFFARKWAWSQVRQMPELDQLSPPGEDRAPGEFVTQVNLKSCLCWKAKSHAIWSSLPCLMLRKWDHLHSENIKEPLGAQGSRGKWWPQVRATLQRDNSYPCACIRVYARMHSCTHILTHIHTQIIHTHSEITAGSP